ncbi:MAG: putative bifunctional diguanylate cyclase/phosphodiesterase [Solirubrobacteraceae bacterium]
MPSEPTNRGRSRWWRLIAGCGAVTTLAALGTIARDGRPDLVSLWLLLAGIAVSALSLVAMRKERAALELLRRRQAERDRAEQGRRAAEARSLELAATSPDIVTLHGPNGTLTYVSPACREVLGFEPEELVGRSGDDFVHADDLPVIVAMRNRAREVDDVSATFRLLRRDERAVWVEAKLHIVRDPITGRAHETHAVIRDVNDRLEAQRALAEAEERFRTAFEEGAAGMAIVSTDGRILRVNRALCAVTGHQHTELEGRSMHSLLHSDDRDQHAQESERMLAGQIATARGERRYLHDDGHVVWVSVSTTLVRDAGGSALHFLTQAQDVTERRRYEAELRHMADHDALTGLLNRRSFERELDRHVDHVARYGPRGAAVLLDVDRFKNVNDTLGHGAGDQLIGKVADTLRERLSDGAVIARLGGDEFAVLVPDGSPDDSEATANELLDAIRKLRISSPSGRLRAVSASIGVAPFDSRRLTGEDVLVNADLAMYEAKESGRDRVVCHGPSKDSSTRLATRLSWTDVIRDALDEERLVLQAQPIMDLASGEIHQYEMLLRMRDPLGELISPADFLPVAERYDLIGEIDKWVVRQAIQMLGEQLNRKNRLVFEVNISGRSTGDPELLELIERELGEHGVAPEQVIFEITETTAVGNIPRAQEFAGHLAALGCRFALDDFGAAFASFYYLKHLPFDYLKIDGEFVRSCMDNRTDQLVIQAVVGIARGLGKRTVAEMVGDQATMDLLAEMGIDHAQGYHIGRPAPLAKWLVEERRKKERAQKVASRAGIA